MRARDGRPLVHVLAAKDTIPDWARGPLSFENLSLAGRLELGPSVAVEQLQGKGGGVGVAGRARKVRGRTDGAITLSFGVLSLKVDLGSGGVRPSIGGGPRSPP